ncbi:MAG: siroheme decarboxylase subunit beta [Methanothrix sp.]
MDELDLELLKVAQEGLDLTERPYRVWGEVLGMREEEIIYRLRAMEEEGIIRRFAATIGHRALGILANALIAWRVPPEKVDEAGAIFAAAEEVTHCYERATAQDWPYNIYTMVHSRSREECLQIAERLSSRSGISDHIVLFSEKEYKKISARI